MVERAINFYDELVHRKMPPTEHVYNSLIRACAGRKDLCIFPRHFCVMALILSDNYNKAFEFFAKMKEDGFHPTIETYTNLLLNSAVRGDFEVI